ncbi:MAG: PDZ domain-containing protein, partial [Oscillospiraceae bacterium]|nr:PDZ domain-containing protein [Oscillospiraceae bacterium]
MSTVITSVDHRSPAQRAGIAAGETLLAVNGHPIVDVLDYRYYCYDPVLELKLGQPDGTERTVQVKKLEGQELGLNFDTYLMDEPRPCSNHCLFCFVDQMPPGMRDTLYFKDDDARLSFLM